MSSEPLLNNYFAADNRSTEKKDRVIRGKCSIMSTRIPMKLEMKSICVRARVKRTPEKLRPHLCSNYNPYTLISKPRELRRWHIDINFSAQKFLSPLINSYPRSTASPVRFRLQAKHCLRQFMPRSLLFTREKKSAKTCDATGDTVPQRNIQSSSPAAADRRGCKPAWSQKAVPPPSKLLPENCVASETRLLT